jgi:hypothetical protein
MPKRVFFPFATLPPVSCFQSHNGNANFPSPAPPVRAQPTFGRFGRGRGGRGGGRGGGRAAAAQADEADSEWLDQIYGQHTIYRRDEGKPAMGATKEEAKTEEAAAA